MVLLDQSSDKMPIKFIIDALFESNDRIWGLIYFSLRFSFRILCDSCIGMTEFCFSCTIENNVTK